jgi:mannose-1-phosphate guanylyltransferase
MQIDYCLILAAGFGTRMGEIGKQLPKVLWPVFEKSLLELQVAYAKSLGVKKIFINLHHMGKEIESFCHSKSAFEDVIFLWESPEILDIGGAVHNLAQLPEVKYKGRLLVLNADQFFYLRSEELIHHLEKHKKAPAVLFNYWVNSNDGYNELQVDEHRFVIGIRKNKDIPRDSKIETYTGISWIDLSQLKPQSGVSSFFESVCPFKEKRIPTVILNQIDYWDFGTINRYWETCFRILQTYVHNSTHPFLRFLVNEKALKTWKINLQKISYQSQQARVINLSEADTKLQSGEAIFFTSFNQTLPQKGKWIFWNSLAQEITEK